MASLKYYSQVKQDEFLHKKIFKNFHKGVFLDLGAFDGVDFSNTYFFEKSLGWDGFCFEPIPEYYKKLKRTRTCKAYNNCIGDSEGVVEFTFVPDDPMLSGISDNLHEADVERIKKIASKTVQIKSKVVDIAKFLRQNKIGEIHILSLDIKGNEECVLKRIDYNKTFIHSICLEDNYNEGGMDGFLKLKGFVLLKHCGFDKIFVNSKSRFYPRDAIILRTCASFINLFYTKSLQNFCRNSLNKTPVLKRLMRKIVGV